MEIGAWVYRRLSSNFSPVSGRTCMKLAPRLVQVNSAGARGFKVKVEITLYGLKQS